MVCRTTSSAALRLYSGVWSGSDSLPRLFSLAASLPTTISILDWPPAAILPTSCTAAVLPTYCTAAVLPTSPCAAAVLPASCAAAVPPTSCTAAVLPTSCTAAALPTPCTAAVLPTSPSAAAVLLTYCTADVLPFLPEIGINAARLGGSIRLGNGAERNSLLFSLKDEKLGGF